MDWRLSWLSWSTLYIIPDRVVCEVVQPSILMGNIFIALTGYGRDSDAARAREAGFDVHLVKPYEFDELEKLITPPGLSLPAE